MLYAYMKYAFHTLGSLLKKRLNSQLCSVEYIVISNIILSPSLSISSLSLCLSSTTYDESRFPQTISEVRCSLEGCLNVAGKEDRSLESKPIYHQILVLRKVMGSVDRYYYRLESKIIVVGCTCVRPSIEHQQ